jgi:hypothetical protein
MTLIRILFYLSWATPSFNKCISALQSWVYPLFPSHRWHGWPVRWTLPRCWELVSAQISPGQRAPVWPPSLKRDFFWSLSSLFQSLSSLSPVGSDHHYIVSFIHSWGVKVRSIVLYPRINDSGISFLDYLGSWCSALMTLCSTWWKLSKYTLSEQWNEWIQMMTFWGTR